MPVFSRTSRERLKQVDPDLRVLAYEVIKTYDHSIMCGFRTSEDQFELFKKGRKLVNGLWIITNKKKVVTYRDGLMKLSKHNFNPSKAMDAVPYIEGKGVTWNLNDCYLFAGYMMRAAEDLKILIRCGGDWDSDKDTTDQKFFDPTHFELVDI